nr:hypothetical protein [Cytophagales bacterium]
MGKYKYIFLLAVACITPKFGSAQVARPEFIPPSPNSYSLAKYGDIPVNLYTGVPDITVPIWTIRENGLSMDISLSYHASGVKVDEISSWVGLGWSLNAGGVIVRKVRGRAEYLLPNGTFSPKRADIGFYNSARDSSRRHFIESNNLPAAASNNLDTAPDEYFFNFNGRSGKFHFDKDGNAFLYKNEDFRIQLVYTSPFNFNILVTTEDGTLYEFADYERSLFPDMGQFQTTSWYLTKIKSPSGAEITIENQPTPTINHDIRQASDYLVELTANPTIYPSPLPVTGTSVSELRVKKIISSTGWVEFKAGGKRRLDYKTSSFPLDSIIVYKADGSPIRKFKINTGYFEANNSNKYNGPNQNLFQHLNYRLRLDSVFEFNGNNEEAKPPYRFVYLGDNNPATNDMHTLPYRLSPSQDHWGYFNNSFNKHIFPGNREGRGISTDLWYQVFAEYSNTTVHNVISNGANRSPHPEASKAGMLKEIHYPTGGFSEFVFEINRYSGSGDLGGGLRIARKRDYTAVGELTRDVSYTYDFNWLYYDPRDFYYKYFRIQYRGADRSPLLGSDLLQVFGLPTTSDNFVKNIIKISTYPLALLGIGGHSGYGKVTVAEAGNGYTVNEFANLSDYPDYYGRGEVYDDIDMFHMDNIFKSQYITSMSNPLGDLDIQLSVTLNATVHDQPYPELYDNSWKRGVMKSRSVHTESGILVKKEEFEYERKLLAIIPGFRVLGWGAYQDFIFARYYIPHASIKPKKQVVHQYDPSGNHSYSTTKEFFYDNPLHAQKSRTVIIKSDGSRDVTHILYPPDYMSGTTFIDNMKTKNLVNYPIETVTYNESGTSRSFISGIMNTYKIGGTGLVDESLQLDLTGTVPLSSFKFSNCQQGSLPSEGIGTTFSPDSRYKNKVTYNSYDVKGNPMQFTIANGQPVTYLWSYDHQYPIAEVRNATASQVSYTSFETDDKGNWNYSGVPVNNFFKTGKKAYNLSSGTIRKPVTGASANNPYKVGFWARTVSGTRVVNISGQTESLTTSWKWVEKSVTSSSLTISGTNILVDELRLHPQTAQMTTYSYDPMVGMLSETDARSYSRFYEYDTFGRLTAIKDDDGQIMEFFEYNYEKIGNNP